MKRRQVLLTLFSVCVVVCATLLAVFYVRDVAQFPFSFGLDLAGGTQVTIYC